MDEVERDLSDLPEGDVDAWRRERIRRISHETLERAPRGGAARVWNRFAEPALLVLVSVAMVVWAVVRVSDILLRG